MLPFGVTIPATVPQGSEIPEGLMNNRVWLHVLLHEKHADTSLPLSDKLSKTNHFRVVKGTWDITCYSDEAWFHLIGYVNSQNTRIWATEHPHEIPKVPLNSEKTWVWCAISRRRIIGPIFSHETLNTARCQEIFNEFVDQLDDDELRNGYFQQDGATCHASNESMTEIESFFWWPDYFESHMAAKISWLKSAQFFFLWGRLKRKSLCQQLENNTRREIAVISEDVLQATFANTNRRVQLCLDSGGEHFQHLL